MLSKGWAFLLFVFSCTATGWVLAQYRQPTDREIEQAAKQHRTPSDQELSKIPVPSTPRIDGIPTPIDLEALANRFEKSFSPGNPTTVFDKPALFVFVTLDMPKASLAALISQAERARATLVLRGLKDRSLKKTAEAVKTILGEHQVAWMIDPQAFARYDVRLAPTIVLVKPGASLPDCTATACIPANRFLKASGDVTLDYALRAMRRDADDFAQHCDEFLKRLETST